MPNEELIKVLRSVIQEELKPITQRLDNIETNISTIETNISAIETNISAIETNISAIETNISAIETNVSTVEGDISTIKATMSTKSDIAELNQLVHAVSLEVIDETHKVESKLDVLNSRLFNQEAELQRLKIAK